MLFASSFITPTDKVVDCFLKRYTLLLKFGLITFYFSNVKTGVFMFNCYVQRNHLSKPFTSEVLWRKFMAFRHLRRLIFNGTLNISLDTKSVPSLPGTTAAYSDVRNRILYDVWIQAVPLRWPRSKSFGAPEPSPPTREDGVGCEIL